MNEIASPAATVPVVGAVSTVDPSTIRDRWCGWTLTGAVFEPTADTFRVHSPAGQRFEVACELLEVDHFDVIQATEIDEEGETVTLLGPSGATMAVLRQGQMLERSWDAGEWRGELARLSEADTVIARTAATILEQPDVVVRLGIGTDGVLESHTVAARDHLGVWIESIDESQVLVTVFGTEDLAVRVLERTGMLDPRNSASQVDALVTAPTDRGTSRITIVDWQGWASPSSSEDPDQLGAQLAAAMSEIGQALAPFVADPDEPVNPEAS